ncbi:MAG TPA: PH domain-containing protein [Acidimicrobiales bacterium]|nr:PH domain-containing protein [Acidimicrobiales bacterium]
MPFPRKLLNEGEDVVLDLRPHWWFLAGPVAALVAFIVLSIAVQSAFDPPDAVTLAMLAIGIVLMIWFLARYAKWSTTNFVVTTDRLIHRSGVIAKHGKEIPLERLNDISFHQSIWERMIGAGDLMIESGGERGQQTFSDIRKPATVQNIIYREIEAAQARDADRIAGAHAAAAGAGASTSIPDQLDRLDDLRRRGVITQAEFDAKKTKLLDQL